MKENMEDIIKQLEVMLKIRKEQKEVVECAGGFCVNCEPDIDALTYSIMMLSRYKRMQEINEQHALEIDNLLKTNELLQIRLLNRISKKKIENKVLELNKEISKMELKFKNSFLKKKEKIREELVRLDERLKTYIELLKEEE